MFKQHNIVNMALISKGVLSSNANKAHQFFYKSSADTVLLESKWKEDLRYDIFLSHAYLDSVEVLGLKDLLTEEGYTVYVDWVEDNLLDRANVTRLTAEIIKKRMLSCKCLFYAYSMNSPQSKWMPWELGVFDGMKGRVAIVPVSDSIDVNTSGIEFLGLYPYVGDSSGTLFLYNDEVTFTTFASWMNGGEPKFFWSHLIN